MSYPTDSSEILKDLTNLARLIEECDTERIKQMRAEDEQFDKAVDGLLSYLLLLMEDELDQTQEKT